jgi:hypothetical protein
LESFLYPAINNPGFAEFRESQGPFPLYRSPGSFMEPTGAGGKGDKELPGAGRAVSGFAVELEDEHIVGTLVNPLYLRAGKIQLGENIVYFLPI